METFEELVTYVRDNIQQDDGQLKDELLQTKKEKVLTLFKVTNRIATFEIKKIPRVSKCATLIANT